MRQVMNGIKMKRKKKAGDAARCTDTPTQQKTNARQGRTEDGACVRWKREREERARVYASACDDGA